MDKIIIKYLSGTATIQEKETLEMWLIEDPKNSELFSKLKHTYTLYYAPQNQVSEGQASEFMTLLKLINKKPKQINTGKSKYYNFKRILVVTSAAAVLVFASMLFYQMQNKIDSYQNDIAYMIEQEGSNFEYSTPFGVKGKVVLPDSTVVWLNSGSKITFPAKFNSKSREVSFSGEGFFEVKTNKETPMDIMLKSGLSVQVLGTKFNLSSYDNDSNVSLLLLSGKVNINSAKGKVLFAVNPNQKITIDPINNKASVNSPLETLPTIGWKNGWLIFENAPLEEVFKKMERWYGQTIVVTDNSIYTKTLTAKFKEESVSQVFDLMNQISLINYQVKDSIAYISNYD